MPESRDGFISLIGGMQQRTDSSMLQSNQYAMGVNISSRKGKVLTRPRFSPLVLSGLPDGLYQGCLRYHLDGFERLLVGIAGSVYGIDLSDLSVINYSSLAGFTFNATVDRLHFVQAEKYAIVQDGTTRGLIIDDATAAQAVDNQVPIGTKMAYGHGRLFIVVSTVDSVTNLGERFFVAGDIMKPNSVSDLLNFTETAYLNGGGAFGLANEMGFITWLGFLRNARTGTGLGSLIVMAQGGCSAFAVNTARVSWQDIDISQVLFQVGGGHAIAGWANVNNDIVYRARDGLRTLGYTAARTSSEAASISNVDISPEVEDLMNLDSRSLQKYITMVNVDNRVLFLSKGSSPTGGPRFKSLVSMDTEVISASGEAISPIYDGIWTGLDMSGLVTAEYNGRDTAFIFAKSGESNLLYRIVEDATYDGATSRPVCRVYTKSYNFSERATTFEYNFVHADIWMSDILGQVDCTIYYRPKGYAYWMACDSFTVCADPAGEAQHRRRIRVNPGETPACDASGMSARVASEFEFCVQFTGHARIDKTIFFVDNAEDGYLNGCDVSDECVALDEATHAGESLDDYSYEVLT